jgi:DNA invertase Pin-like site-specific DNA recombinase
VKDLIEAEVNIYFQKESFYLLDENKKPSLITPILLAALGTAAQLERENIQYRLNSGRAQYINNGGKLGRKVGSVKSKEQKQREYSDVIRLLQKQYYTLREVAKLSGVSVSTVQRIKKEFCYV